MRIIHSLNWLHRGYGQQMSAAETAAAEYESGGEVSVLGCDCDEALFWELAPDVPAEFASASLRPRLNRAQMRAYSNWLASHLNDTDKETIVVSHTLSDMIALEMLSERRWRHVRAIHGHSRFGSETASWDTEVLRKHYSGVNSFVVWGPRVASGTSLDFDIDTDKIVITGFGRIDENFFTPDNDNTSLVSDYPIIVMTSRLMYNKNSELIIRALPKVLKRYPAAKLEIYGDGPDRPGLKKLIDELGLSGNAVLLGNIPDVLESIQSADLFVLPSFDEGVSRALVEAALLKIPVCVSVASEAVVAFGKFGEVHDPYSVESAELAIIRALENTSLEKTAGFKEFVEDAYSMEAHLSNMQKAYSLALG